MRKIFFLSFVFWFLIFPSSIFAQQQTNSNTTSTKVGNPKVATGQLSDILSWDQKINDALQLGYDGSYDKMIADISNNGYSATKELGTSKETTYWCTFSVIDAYNLAGITGPKLPDHGSVVNLVAFWKQAPGFKYLDYISNTKSALQQVQPGFAIFFQQSPGSFGDYDHTAIVKSITIDTNGNGLLTTMDSNTPWKELQYPVHNWALTGFLPDSPPEGFGGI